MISWSSQKQKTVADLSCYPEYITLHDSSHKVIFLRQLLKGLQLLPNGPMQLPCDNDNDATSCLTGLTEDHVWHCHTKHIWVKYHYAMNWYLLANALSYVLDLKTTLPISSLNPWHTLTFNLLCQGGLGDPMEPDFESSCDVDISEFVLLVMVIS